ncbi:hypothetical protein H2200_002606 [Cladophialophora chaetospira]|uniref:Uncharacterized protein n=1 Tax=Cladophialophora chaetospira TaxID=386627 RepID=A0AA39CN72_9EURO|nr:hypothetical protein H2200_002606 [Cladophialophora chaetospira]
MAETYPFQTWESSPGQAFREAETDFLFSQLDSQPWDKLQRQMIKYRIMYQYRRHTWHYPAPPYDWETEENTDRLLPTFTYDFIKRGDRWIFYRFRFDGKWKCDPDTGNLVATSFKAWCSVLDKENHFRQQFGKPLLQSPCLRFLDDNGDCTCGACPNAPRFSGPRGSHNVDPVQSAAEVQPVGASEPSEEGPATTERNRTERRVRFVVASEESSRVRFLVSSPDVSTSPTHPATAHPRRSILKVKYCTAASLSEEKQDTTRRDPRPTAPLLLPLTSYVTVFSTQSHGNEAPRSFNLASKAARTRKHRSSKLVIALEEVKAIPVPVSRNQSAVESNYVYASFPEDWENSSQSSTEWEIIRQEHKEGFLDWSLLSTARRRDIYVTETLEEVRQQAMASTKSKSKLPAAPTRLRQIALVAEDLDRARYLLTTILGTEVVFVDEQVAQWGLKNFLVAIGGDIIEVVAPFKPGTTAGRLLQKRGNGGYMIIMQTVDAAARRKYIESNNLAKVIWTHSYADSEAVQYHPKGIAGGIMPELDSHAATASNPNPLESTFSPWHACGPDFDSYSAGMKRCSHLKLISATLRLGAGQSDVGKAAQQWEDYFGIKREQDQLLFTNARLKFIAGVEGQPDGLDSITIQIKGKERYEKTLERAAKEGVCGDGWVNLLGVKWYFVLDDGEGQQRGSKL